MKFLRQTLLRACRCKKGRAFGTEINRMNRILKVDNSSWRICPCASSSTVT